MATVGPRPLARTWQNPLTILVSLIGHLCVKHRLIALHIRLKGKLDNIELPLQRKLTPQIVVVFR